LSSTSEGEMPIYKLNESADSFLEETPLPDLDKGAIAPPEDLLEGVEALVGSRPIGASRATGGFSIAERWSLELQDGRRVFAKMATTNDIARRLRAEHRNMVAVPREFRCEVIAWQDGKRPLLVVEDLSQGRWPPPWEPGDVERVVSTLERLWSTPPPDHFPSAEQDRKTFSGWHRVSADPEGFLGLGICSREWTEQCLPTLIEAERTADLDGDDLIHLDVRSDNLCFAHDRVVLIDWNFACRGRRDLDLALWLPSLRLEGGPLPEEVLQSCGEYAAAWTGVLAHGAPLPPPTGAPTVRSFQLRQLRIALPWACRELSIPEPDLPWATHEIGRIDGELASGRIGVDEWHAQIEEVIGDAYLSHSEPWRQSGKSGDEADWRWSRELILDACPGDCDFLDIGCANGYLMECIQRWGRERGLRVEPHGLDISWRLASLARRRLPSWADRIYEGNAMSWAPPRRFDVVHSGLDYVPPARRRDLVEHLLKNVVAAHGRLVLRPERMRPGEPTPADELEAIGFRPDGVLQARHPRTGELRSTAWLAAP